MHEFGAHRSVKILQINMKSLGFPITSLYFARAGQYGWDITQDVDVIHTTHPEHSCSVIPLITSTTWIKQTNQVETFKHANIFIIMLLLFVTWKWRQEITPPNRIKCGQRIK